MPVRCCLTAFLLAAVAAALVAPGARADATFPRHSCHGSAWMTSAGSAWGTSDTEWRRTHGPAANFMVSLRPTSRARNAHQWAGVWTDLRRCVKLPSDLTRARKDSLYKQLVCHVVWSTGSVITTGGKTWDLEAWRSDVSLASVLSLDQILDPAKRCNWGRDTGPPLPG